MSNEHTFANDTGAAEQIAVALGELNRVRVGPMSPSDADRALGLLGRMQAVVKSLMCDVTRQVAESNSGADPAEVLRQGARLPGRESRRMAKVTRQLSQMPKVKERFAAGSITPDHVKALANAAEKVGPEAVEADPGLLDAADRLLPDTFDRHARDWSNRKLIEQGLDPLQRQQKAREAKLWVEKDTGLGVLLAKLPGPQFAHLRQAIDNRYLHHHRQDSADGNDPNTVRSPEQRLADTVFELITNRDAATGEPIGTSAGGNKPKAATQLVPGRALRRGGRHRPRRTGRDHRSRPRTRRHPPYPHP